MSTDPTAHDEVDASADDRGEEVDVASQVAEVIEVCEEIGGIVAELSGRLDAVERLLPQVLPGETRTDFRPDLFPPAESAEDRDEQMARVDAAWARLDEWVCWLVGAYRLTSVIPVCWAEHTAVAHELIGLRVAWVGAWLDSAPPDALLAWHERLHRARARLGDGNWGRPRCEDAAHSGTGMDLVEIWDTWAGDPRRAAAVDAARRRALLLVPEPPDADDDETPGDGEEQP